jgi:hypothetical protein
VNDHTEVTNLPTTAVPGAAAMMPAPTTFSFAPTTLAEAMELAGMLASSTMVPKSFQGNPGNCFLAMQWGAELEMKPLQAIQCIAVINGKPGIYGDAGKAMLLNKGCQIDERDIDEIRQTGIASCTIARRGRVPVTRTFSIEDAKRARLWEKDGPWQLYPYRQLAWRAFWFAARDAAADILRGMAGVEELADVEIEVTGTVVQEPAKTSKSDRVLDRLKSTTTVERVVAAFDAAATEAELTAAVELARKLPEGERKDAEKAYRNATARLKARPVEQPATTPPAEQPAEPAKDAGLSFDYVKAALAGAKTVDALDVATDLINGLTCADDLKAALRADAAALRTKMQEAA